MTATWEPDSTVVLCNVPWDMNYDNVVAWKHSSGNNKDDVAGALDKDGYFSNLSTMSNPVTLIDSTYFPMGTVQITVDVPFPRARMYNYVVVTNPELPTDVELSGWSYPLVYYYFITKADQPNPSTTTFTLQLDVWTTYYPDYLSMGVGYVERGHVGMLNAPLHSAVYTQYSKNLPYALDAYCSESEGIDTGGEFQTYYEEAYSLQRTYSMDDDKNLIASDVSADWVVVVSTASLKTDPGTVNSPKLRTSAGGIFDFVPSGCDVYAFPLDKLEYIMSTLAAYSWVSQCIISLTVVPAIVLNSTQLYAVDFLTTKVSQQGSTPYFYELRPKPATDMNLARLCGSVTIKNIIENGWTSEYTETDLSAYKNIKKLWCYPYTVVELYGNGQSVFLKPQLFGSCDMLMYAYTSPVSPFATIAAYPTNYGNHSTGKVEWDSSVSGNEVAHTINYGDFLDVALWWDNFPQFGITNNSYITYMAQTANVRNYQYASAEWTQASANLTANNTYANTSSYLQLANQNANLSIENERANNALSNQQTLNNARTSAITGTIGAVGNLVSGNYASAVTGGIETALNAYNANANLELTKQMQTNNLNLQAAQLSNSQTTGYEVADRNLALSQTVASGNYDVQIQGIDAAYADAALKTPSSSGNTGGAGFKYSRGLYFAYSVRYKRVSPAAIRRVGDYFLRFGYTIKRFIDIPETLALMKYYTYWKVQQLEIQSANITETEKDAFRGLFAKGVTVWQNPSNIGHIKPIENQPIDEMESTYYI